MTSGPAQRTGSGESTLRSLSDAGSLEDRTRRQRALAAEEEASLRTRLTQVLWFSLPVWTLGAAIDVFAAHTSPETSLSGLLCLRAVGCVGIVAVLARLRWGAPPRWFELRVLDVLTFSSAALLLSWMSLLHEGTASVYGQAVLCVQVARAIARPERWRKGLYYLGLPTAAWPVTLAVASQAMPRVAAQFRALPTRTAYTQTTFMLLVAYALLVVGGHAYWALRRRTLENRKLGRYELRTLLGKGAMGEVWRAFHPGLGCDVAVKLLLSGRRHERAVARFMREVRMTAELQHPHTVRILECGVSAEGQWYYAMELLDGETLGERVKRDGPLAPAAAVALLRQAARAVAEAHRRGIVHRDIKPENLFLVRQEGIGDYLKVLDFGLAKASLADGDAGETHADAVVGTPMYMSPEQGLSAEADARSDVYSLGAVLYLSLTGRAPFEGRTAAAVVLAHINTPAEAPSVRASQPLPPALDALVLRCLAKSADERYADAGALDDALAALEATALAAVA